eukprot:COSAG02_NODE_1320_length_13269_cov_11.420058_6_plen_414_part_00
MADGASEAGRGNVHIRVHVGAVYRADPRSKMPKAPQSHDMLGLELLSHFTEQERERDERERCFAMKGVNNALLRGSEASGHATPNMESQPHIVMQTSMHPTAPQRDSDRFSLSENMNFVMATVHKGQADPFHRFSVHELLGLLRAPRWSTSGEPIPTRPLLIKELASRTLYREPTLYSRRHRQSYGRASDRWRNSGGKNAAVAMEIPLQFRRDGYNVIVQRHGRVLRPNGLPQLRYRKWSFGRADRSGVVVDNRSSNDGTVLYLVFPIFNASPTAIRETKRQKLGSVQHHREPLQTSAVTALDYSSIDGSLFGCRVKAHQEEHHHEQQQRDNMEREGTTTLDYSPIGGNLLANQAKAQQEEVEKRTKEDERKNGGGENQRQKVQPQPQPQQQQQQQPPQPQPPQPQQQQHLLL